jgi:hypothetical protein
MVTYWNGFGSLLPLNILERNGYVLEWVLVLSPIEHYGWIGYVLEWIWVPLPIEHSGEDGYVVEWVWFSPQLNIMDGLVTYWNGFGSLFPLNILERMVTYWNGFGSISDPFECISRTQGLSSSTPPVGSYII